MQINSHGKNLKIHLPENQAKPNPKAGSTDSGNGVEQTEQVKPQGLLDRLHGDAKVRERLLVEIESKIQTGEFLTRSAAVETAQAIADL